MLKTHRLTNNRSSSQVKAVSISKHGKIILCLELSFRDHYYLIKYNVQQH
jgi:hypothetical protein